MRNLLLNRLLISTTLVLVLAAPAQAHDTSVHNHEQRPHVHGIAELTIAVEDYRVDIQLTSPAANIIGFEHKPLTLKQEEQLKSAKNTLKAADTLFRFKSSNCHAVKQDIRLSVVDKSEHGHNHSEIEASYLFECTGDVPTAIYIGLLDHFSGIENLRAQWITDNNQGAKQLAGNSRWIKLR